MPDLPEHVRFAYPRRIYLVALVAALALLGATAALALPRASETAGTLLYAAALAVEGFVVLVYILPVLLTSHELLPAALRLRFGLFAATVPYELIETAQLHPLGGLPRLFGWGVRYAARLDRLVVLSSHQGLVEVRLRSRARLGAFWTQYLASGVILNLRAPEGFIRQLEARLHRAAGGVPAANPPPTHG